MSTFTIPAGGLGVAADCGVNGSVITNRGAATVYYRDEAPISATTNDGSIAAAGTATLTGTRYFFVAAGSATLTTVAVPATSGPANFVDGTPNTIAGNTTETGDLTVTGTLTTSQNLVVAAQGNFGTYSFFGSSGGGGLTEVLAAFDRAAGAQAPAISFANENTVIRRSGALELEVKADNGFKTTGRITSGTDLVVNGAVYVGSLSFADNSAGSLRMPRIQTQAAQEAATASAGSGGVIPATVQGYVIFRDSGNVDRKIPYFAT